MRPMRGTGGMGFPSTRSAGAKLAIALIVVSVLTLLLRRVGIDLLLVPGKVFHGALWQPFSFVFAEVDPFGILFGAMILWSIGGAIEQTWGSRRFVAFAIGS